MTTNTDTGLKGEEIAARYLLSIGYDIRGRNVRVGHDEIDIIAHDPVDDVIVFAEVKTRSKLLKDFPPELGIDWRKKQRLIHAARAWVHRHHYDRGYRMDLVSVEEGKVSGHLKELDWDQ
ncbi:MAG: YraN family protein [Candidatus Peribacteraceae bacterium]|nr:YraN family protein [Candidatus Peribacteraceae bacterium]MDD5739635.1 YraN family protein [Candidatus Peribacteraceae bacterium]